MTVSMAEQVRKPRIDRAERPENLPLSYAQEQLWFLDRLKGESREYQMREALRLRGQLDVGALTRALAAIVARHESLRTSFGEVKGMPTQVIAPPAPVSLPLDDLRGQPAADQAAAIQTVLQAALETPLDLARGPLLRMRLLQLGDEEHVLVRTLHHIVSDGWSQRIFNRELFQLYAAEQVGQPAALPPLPVQYADFALWQRRWLADGVLAGSLRYWTTQLAGSPEQLQLPTDRPRPAVQTYAAAVHHVTVPAALVAAVRRVSQARHATPYMVLLAAYGVLLARYSGAPEVVVGSPIADRPDARLESLIGLFVNGVAIRVRVEAARTFEELLAQVRRTMLDAYRHRDAPFGRVVEALAPMRSLSYPPVFQVTLVMHNRPQVAPQLPGLTVEAVAGETLQVRFDLEVHVSQNNAGLEMFWLYNRNLFDAWRIEQMASHYLRILRMATQSP